jgi:drug/metabolite transporter (DMT)-like permease
VPADIAIIALPLTAALLFAIAAVLLKRASQLGAGVWQTTLFVNIVAAICYSALWLLGGPPVNWSWIWQPALISVCLFAGMAAQFVALEKGDVSVAVPILGLKVIFVAFLTPILVGEYVGAGLWIAAVFSVLGVAFLNRGGPGIGKQGMGPAIIAGGCASACFAIFDLLVQEWGPVWGTGRLLPIVFWINALLSLIGARMGSVSLAVVPHQAWRSLIVGGLLIALQSALFVGCLSIYGKATAANIIYSARGLMSVILATAILQWSPKLQTAGTTHLLGWRLAGAVLLLVAVVIATFAA